MSTNFKDETSNCMHLCAVITLYFPSKQLLANIASYSNFVEALYIVDNTPQTDLALHKELLCSHAVVKIVSHGKNIGVASALNAGIDEALRNKFSWLLTMDQDSYFENEQAKRYFNSIAEINVNEVAVIAPLHRKVAISMGPCKFEKKYEVWTSGSLINLSHIHQIGKFDERLFIDSVDHDFCLRVNLLGLKVLQTTNCYMHHSLGTTYHGSMLFGLKKKSYPSHSPKRMYFIVRNGWYIIDTYKKDFPDYSRLLKSNILQVISRCLRYHSQRVVFAQYIIKGVVDYKRKLWGNRVGI